MNCKYVRRRRQRVSACHGAVAIALAAGIAASAGVASAQTPTAVFNSPTTSSPIAISANNQLVWSVNPKDNSVSVIRADTGAVVKRIVVGTEPQSVALDPNNEFAFVANAASSNVSVIEITNANPNNFNAAVERTLRTGAEPWNIAISPNGRRVFVANSAQDTVTVINALTRTIIGQVNLRNSLCNDPDRQRHFQPRGLAVTQDNTKLYVTRFLSFVREGGRQAADAGKEGAVCQLNINTNSTNIAAYSPAKLVRMPKVLTGFAIDSTGDGVPDPTSAFANQLQSIVIRGNRAFLPNIASSPKSPTQFQNETEAFVNFINGVNGDNPVPFEALNLHLGARNPEPGKKKLFFANVWGMGFTNQSGAGNAYVVSAGSDLLVKLNVNANNTASFTVDGDTTRYIDLNDPNNPDTSGANACKNPRGIAVTSDGARAFVMCFVSRNVVTVNLNQDRVIDSVRTFNLPAPGSQAEQVLVGAEQFFSSRGHYNDDGLAVSTDERLSSEGWQNCASCHFEGLTDGTVWSFGNGPRKSISLGGTFDPRNRSRQRILNYSAARDQPQDFDLNTRNVSSAGPVALDDCSAPPPDQSTFDPNHGLILGDVNRNQRPCVINDFLKSNANRTQVTVTLPGSNVKVKALDALNAWIKFAVRAHNGPLTDEEIAGGVPAADISQGRALFQSAGCARCHNGGSWTKSIVDFTPPPNVNDIFCEAAVVGGPPGCQTAPVVGNPVAAQFLDRFLEDVGSFNLGVPGEGNPIGNDIGADELVEAKLVGPVSQPQQDALGIDYNDDGKGVGFSVSSLLGIHGVPPYGHNGACETIACVVGDAQHRTGNGRFPDTLGGAAQQRRLTRFVESIDPATQPFN